MSIIRDFDLTRLLDLSLNILIAFTLAASSPISSIVVPGNGQAAFDAVQPFQWSAVPLARGYELTIGSTPGGNDLHDSGVISVTFQGRVYMMGSSIVISHFRCPKSGRE